MIKVNDTVKFIHPSPDESPDDTFRVVEVNGDRCMIESAIPGFLFYGIEVVKVADLERI